MKIYFIGQKGIPAKFGGVERHVEELAARLVKAGQEVYVYTRPHYTRPSLKKWRGINLISLPSIKSKYLDAITHTFRACLDVMKQDADIVHFHSIGPASLIWLVKLFRPGLPIVATFHCQDYYHQKWGLLARLYLKLGERAACRLADKTITVSRQLKKYGERQYGRDMRYIPNGVALPKLSPSQEITKRWGLVKDNYILAVSRLVRHKGIHYLIEAYKQLNTGKKLVIAGDGAYTDAYVEELRSLAADDSRIIFTGNQTGRALEELFSNAYLFVQPSESEGLSIALLEAMSYGRPVLVSDIPENKEAIGAAGFTFKNKSINSLVKNLTELLNRPALLEKTGQAARERVKAEYSWDKISRETVKLYKDLLKEQVE